MNAIRFVIRRLLLIAIIARKHFFRNALALGRPVSFASRWLSPFWACLNR